MPDRKAIDGPVVVTGGSGFVGATLIRTLRERGVEVRELRRAELQEIERGEDLSRILRGSTGVIHLAARAHVLAETDASLLETYRRSNRDLTVALARAAVEAKVPRFVFVSSIRVNGSSSDRPFRAGDQARPDEPYAVSKFEAEQGLFALAKATGLEAVVVRPPLVYGPGVKANFLRLLRLAASGVPLPLASVQGRRSLIGLTNLCDVLHVCLTSELANGRVLLVSDGEDITLPDLIRELAAGMDRPARLFPLPMALLRGVTGLAGLRTTFEKLTASLLVDPAESFEILRWRPTLSLREGLHETARWFAESRLGRYNKRE